MSAATLVALGGLHLSSGADGIEPAGPITRVWELLTPRDVSATGDFDLGRFDGHIELPTDLSGERLATIPPAAPMLKVATPFAGPGQLILGDVFGLHTVLPVTEKSQGVEGVHVLAVGRAGVVESAVPQLITDPLQWRGVLQLTDGSAHWEAFEDPSDPEERERRRLERPNQLLDHQLPQALRERTIELLEAKLAVQRTDGSVTVIPLEDVSSAHPARAAELVLGRTHRQGLRRKIQALVHAATSSGGPSAGQESFPARAVLFYEVRSVGRDRYAAARSRWQRFLMSGGTRR